MVFVITGAIGVGKTTVCRKLIDMLRDQGHTCAGVLSFKTTDQGISVENVLSGEIESLAGIDNVYNGPHTARYSFNPDGIRFGIRAIEEGVSADILLIDEVGHLELRGEGFIDALEIVNTDQMKDCILVIRKDLLPAFTPQLCTVESVFEVTGDNRNQLPQEICSVLLKKIQ